MVQVFVFRGSLFNCGVEGQVALPGHSFERKGRVPGDLHLRFTIYGGLVVKTVRAHQCSTGERHGAAEWHSAWDTFVLAKAEKGGRAVYTGPH